MLIPVLNIPVVNGIAINVATRLATDVVVRFPLYLSRKMITYTYQTYQSACTQKEVDELIIFSTEEIDGITQHEENVDGEEWVSIEW